MCCCSCCEKEDLKLNLQSFGGDTAFMEGYWLKKIAEIALDVENPGNVRLQAMKALLERFSSPLRTRNVGFEKFLKDV